MAKQARPLLARETAARLLTDLKGYSRSSPLLDRRLTAAYSPSTPENLVVRYTSNVQDIGHAIEAHGWHWSAGSDPNGYGYRALVWRGNGNTRKNYRATHFHTGDGFGNRSEPHPRIRASS